MTTTELKKVAELIGRYNTFMDGIERAKKSKILSVKNEYNNVLIKIPMSQEFIAYLGCMADQVLDELAEMGIDVHDEINGGEAEE